MKEKPQLDLTKVVLSPMPGVVKGVSVEVGQMVGEGHECCIVEAMKMQNSMKATVTSKVKAIHVSGLAINSFFPRLFATEIESVLEQEKQQLALSLILSLYLKANCEAGGSI